MSIKQFFYPALSLIVPVSCMRCSDIPCDDKSDIKLEEHTSYISDDTICDPTEPLEVLPSRPCFTSPPVDLPKVKIKLGNPYKVETWQVSEEGDLDQKKCVIL